ncbi:MAG: putative toxin-antitoxin system toxin component, PIN family [Nitrospirae bacterium CG02_land_8_20_14_3_00_44_33]|nr:MAG: putative toxin-antitoxin system toxin component, PIN family [Nitrospirae bacterium CG02_land_8_20_14_3_00_44_33]
MKVVFDTNVIISSLIFDGTPRRLLDLARHGRFQLILSEFILKETSNVLAKKFGWEENPIGAAIIKLSSIAEIIEPDVSINVIKNADSDNRILECGVAANADIIVSGDTKHILPLKNYHGINIISPIEFLGVLESK